MQLSCVKCKPLNKTCTGCLKKCGILSMMKASIVGPAGAIGCTVGTCRGYRVHWRDTKKPTIEAVIIRRFPLFFRHPVLNRKHPLMRRLSSQLHIINVRNKEEEEESIQHTEGTKDVPSGKRGWHRPSHWNMRRLGISGAAPPEPAI